MFTVSNSSSLEPYTGCIISFSGREDENENVIEITNSIDIFTALDIVIVVQTFLPCFVQKRFKDIPTVFTISVYIFVWETLTFLGISRATSSVKESINFLLYYYFHKKSGIECKSFHSAFLTHRYFQEMLNLSYSISPCRKYHYC